LAVTWRTVWIQANASFVTAGPGLYLVVRWWQMSEQTYDQARAKNLEAMLRALAARIAELDEKGALLAQASELTKLIGDVRSELFHYEVRATYDTPEIAESRRIVERAKQSSEEWQKSEWTRDRDDDPTW
jgi:hypothetical protein